jgi:hypothetical protein
MAIGNRSVYCFAFSLFLSVVYLPSDPVKDSQKANQQGYQEMHEQERHMAGAGTAQAEEREIVRHDAGGTSEAGLYKEEREINRHEEGVDTPQSKARKEREAERHIAGPIDTQAKKEAEEKQVAQHVIGPDTPETLAKEAKEVNRHEVGVGRYYTSAGALGGRHLRSTIEIKE